MAENDNEQKDSSDSKPRAFETIEERLAKKRQKVSVSKIIFYIITLIIAVILMLWLRRGGYVHQVIFREVIFMNQIGRYIIMIFLSFALMIGSIASGSDALRTVLDNGMIVIVKENHAAPVVSLHAYVRAGSIYEREYLGRGISHNLEHLMNSGTQKRTKEQINQIIEEIGNVSNAYTTRDHASYYVTTASSYFDTALDVLSDYIQNASIPQAEVDSERGVILNEINMGKDDPDRRLYDLFSSSYVPG